MEPLALLPSVLDPRHLLGYGAVVLLLIVFAETGLLVGFFLPGDSLLFLAGVLAASGQFSLPALLVGTPIAAFVGAVCGWAIGHRIGPVLFDKPDSRLFKQSNVRKAEAYLERFGEGRAVVMARFVPVVRTFMNPVAGVLRMPLRRFLVASAVGAVLWGLGVPLVGYAVGKALGSAAGGVSIDKYILPITLVIIVLSFVPVLLEVRKARREGRELQPEKSE